MQLFKYAQLAWTCTRFAYFSILAVPVRRVMSHQKDSADLFFSEDIDALPDPPIAVAKRRKRTVSVDTDSAIDASDAKRLQSRSKLTLMDKFGAQTCDLVCDICGKKDSDPDRITPKYPLLWGYYERKSRAGPSSIGLLLMTDGKTCWYCMRVWNARFMVEFPKLKEYKKHVETELNEITYKVVSPKWLS